MLRSFLTLSSGEAVARALHALAILLLVRRLRPEAFGSFELAVAILSYAVLAVQQGFDTIAIREASREPGSAGGWLGRVVRLRLVFALPAALGLAAAGAVYRDSSVGVLLLVLSASCLANALSPKWVFLALEKAVAPAAAAVLAQAVFLAVVAVFVQTPGHAIRAAGGWVLGETVATLFLWTRWQVGDLPHYVSPNRVSWRYLLRESWPVTLILLFGLIMHNFDALALAMLGRQREIGFYLAAYRCTTVFWPVMMQLQSSLLPRMVRWQSGGQSLTSRMRVMTLWSALPALAAAGILSASAPWLLELLFGAEYREAAAYLSVLAWVLPLQVVRLVARQVLVAEGRQASETWYAAFGATANVVLDFALIPSLGAMGCAFSTLFSATVMAAANWRAATRRSGEPPR